MSMYLPIVAGAAVACFVFSMAIPAWRRPLMVAAVLLVAATVFAPDLAPGLRVLAAALAILAVMGVWQLLRQP
jgi:hypothetical protein